MLQYLWGWYPERTNSVSDFWKFPPQHQRCRPTCLRWFPSNLHLLYITLWSDPLLLHYHAAFQFSFLIYMQYTHITSVCNMLHFEFFFNIFTSCGTLQPICLPLRVTLLYRRRVCGVSLSIPAFRLHCPLSIALYCIALSTSPRLPSALLTWLAVGVSLEIFHSLDFADLQLGGGHQLEVLVQVRTSSVICSLTSAWSSLAFLCFELYCKTSHFLGPVCL